MGYPGQFINSTGPWLIFIKMNLSLFFNRRNCAEKEGGNDRWDMLAHAVPTAEEFFHPSASSSFIVSSAVGNGGKPSTALTRYSRTVLQMTCTPRTMHDTISCFYWTVYSFTCEGSPETNTFPEIMQPWKIHLQRKIAFFFFFFKRWVCLTPLYNCIYSDQCPQRMQCFNKQFQAWYQKSSPENLTGSLGVYFLKSVLWNVLFLLLYHQSYSHFFN